MKPENWLKEVEFCLLHRRMLQEARPQYVNQIMEDNLTVVMRACREGCNIFVQYLIDYSKSMNINQQNERGFTALCFAVWNSKVECARILLSHPNIDVNVKCGELEKTVLWYCEDRSCFDLLLPYYPRMNEHEKNMAWLWGRYYHDEVGFDVKEMLKQFPRSALRQMSDDLSSLLWLAAEKRDSETIKYLLVSYDDIIDINMQDKNGNTALREAILWNNEDCIELLFDHPNLDLTLKDKKGKPVYDNTIIQEYKNQEQLFGRNSGRKVASLLCRNKTVRWNRSKIMLVGQGRAGKTALANNLAGRWIGETESTIGAERMDMSLFYGRVKLNRLEEDARPEQELETFIAELSYRESRRNHRVWKDPKVDTTSGWAKGISIFSPTNQAEDQEDAPSPTRPALTPVRKFEPLNEKEITPLAVSVKLDEIRLNEVDLHYRKLQEMKTASRYKLIFLDFGGQSIFNVLHGFFMSRYGIYLVVFDMELFMSIDPAKHDCCCKELKFWLNSITMHTYDINTGKTAPVAIVGTRGDKIWRIQDHQTISSRLAEMFGETKVWQSLILYVREGDQLCFFPNNNKLTKNNTVAQQLLRGIEQSLGAADSMNQMIPIFWIKIFDTLKDLCRSYVSYDEVVRFFQQKLERGEAEDEVVLDREKRERMEVRKMLRFFNDMGMLMWIEEKGLEDVVILDPIKYLVKPATIIICKHLATRDDPYRTRHEIATIHGDSKKILTEDWLRMLEFGLLSESLARDLLERFIFDQNNYDDDVNNGHISLDQILAFMIRFGLLVPFFAPSTPSGKSENKNLYFVPALLPVDPSMLDDKMEDQGLKSMFNRLQLRYGKMSASVNIGMNYSLFCCLPSREGSSERLKSGCDVFSSVELSQKGFLPQSLYERLICRYIQHIGGYDQIAAMDKGLSENELITGFKGKVEFTCQHHRIRLTEVREENRIEVIIQSHDPSRLSLADLQKEQRTFREIYDLTVNVMELLLRECYEGLEVKTLIPPPQSTGFITLKKVRSLLSSASSPFEDSKDRHLVSHDASYSVTLSSGEMKRSSYWSVWKELTIPQQTTSLSPSISSSIISGGKLKNQLLAPPLKAQKKTHVFLSHDWGIDSSNHHRVKQVSEALKSRGLTTWIDDERIVTEIDKVIIDGINQTECMVVFVTENYVKKVNGTNDKDYCKREFEYGFQVFGRQKMIAVVLDKAMKDKRSWEGLVSFNLGPTLYYDLSMIFESSSNQSEARINEVINGLYDRIIKAIRST